MARACVAVGARRSGQGSVRDWHRARSWKFDGYEEFAAEVGIYLTTGEFHCGDGGLNHLKLQRKIDELDTIVVQIKDLIIIKGRMREGTGLATNIFSSSAGSAEILL